MDQHIDVPGQVEHRRVVFAPALGTRPHLRRAVVGDVGDGGVAVAHPVPDRPPALVGDVPCRDPERADRDAVVAEGVGRQHVERPVPAQVPGTDGEQRRRHHPGQHALGIGAVLLRREPQRDLGVGVVPALEERQPLNVVPVQMRQEDGAGERPPFQQSRNPADAGSGIEQEGGRDWPDARRRRRLRAPRRTCAPRSGRIRIPGAGVDPRAPQKWTRTRSVSRLVFAAVPLG